MAKPDLQEVYVKPDDGVVRRLKGKLGLAAAFDNLVEATDNTTAAAAGVPVGGLYHNSGSVKVRTA
jgi:hypothetical protein